MEGKKLWKKYAIIIFVIVVVAWSVLVNPSNDRDWNLDQKVLSYSEIDENFVTIYNIRNFSYESTSEYIPSYYNKTFDLDKLDSLWFIVEPFSEWDGAAHTFVSFGFDDEFLSISVEIRKEVGESFSSIKGLFRQYELMYVIGDENDLIKLRSNYRKDDVYLYPINTTKDKIRQIFLDMIKRVNKLKEEPEFYNTISSTCTTNLADHVNIITPNRIPFSFKILAPGYSGELAYDLGLIKTNMSFEETKKYYKINERAMKYGDSANFSLNIRNFSH